MANVVDPNSWRMIPVPDPQSSNGASGRRALASVSPGAESSTSLGDISAALVETFSGRFDRVAWNLRPRWRKFGVDGENGQWRVDARHECPLPAAADQLAGHTDEAAHKPWLVLVESEETLGNEAAEQRIREARDQDANVLVVVCRLTGKDAAPQAPSATAAAAQQWHFDYWQHTAGESFEQTLASIKQRGRSTLVYLDAQTPLAPPHFDVRDAEKSPAAEHEVSSLRALAIAALSALSTTDSRIAACSTDVDPLLPTAWSEPGAAATAPADRARRSVQHCLALVEQGQRPFLFVALDETLDCLGQLYADIATQRLGITLLVEARRGARGRAPAGSAGLAALRQLPHTSLLSPKDGVELEQMLTWCLEQSDPAILWLPDEVEPPVAWPRGSKIEAGSAERLGTGSDVTIVAWGPLVAAAAVAAERLAKHDIGATVVNARFAQPLDTEALVAHCGPAAFVVIADDASSGGFAAWVAEQLTARGMAQNLSIVRIAPAAPPAAEETISAMGEAIFERCRWLSEPVGTLPDGLVTMEPVAPAVGGGACDLPLDEAGLRVDPAAVDLQSQVLAQQFGPFIEDWVERYARVGERDVYLWRWCLRGLELTTLSSVPPKWRQELCDTKLLAVMFGVMLDDVADQAGGEAFLSALIELITGDAPPSFQGFSEQQQEYAEFTRQLWDTLQQRLQCAPCHDEYAELLDFDHRQIVTTFAYSCMVNKRPALLNLQEHDMYLPHNMQMMSFATMDLMHSPDFDRSELGRLREVIWHAQSMGRIGNLVSTWQREIADRDFTSGVFARALRQGDLTHQELETAEPQYLQAAIQRGRHEEYFLRRWLAHRQAIQSLAGGIQSVDVEALLQALSQLIRMELISRGLK